MTLARYRASKVTLPNTLPNALSTLTLSALFLFAPFASGLGLGDITVHSSLDEPLEASIQLVQLDGLDAELVSAELASRDEFERSDINYSPFLDNLSFSVEVRGQDAADTADTAIVTLSSARPLQTDLAFIVALRWPEGRLLREYTLLADPAERSIASAITAAGDYPVGEAETLWQVALRVRQDRSVSVQQVMIALQRENESAFINGNINNLRSDAVLRVPALGRQAMPTQSVALAEVQQQNRSAGLLVSGNAGLGELRLLDDEALAEAAEGAGSELNEPLATLDSSTATQPSGSHEVPVSTAEIIEADEIDVDRVQTEAASIALPPESVEAERGREGEKAALTNWLKSPLALLSGAALLVAFVLGLLFVARRRVAAQAVPTFDTRLREKPTEQKPMPDDSALSASKKSAVVDAPVESAEEEDFNLGGMTFDEDDFDAADDSADYGANYDDETPIDEDEPLSSRVDLAVAFEAMGDLESARRMLHQVLETGSDYDQEEARRLLKVWDSVGQ